MIMNKKQHIPIFISSTHKDLILYRKAVLNSLDKLRVAVKGMEVFGARTEEPLETCLSEVEKCEIFIGILGMRYGSIDEKTGKSFVQREYEKAKEKSLVILIYRIDESKPLIPPKLTDFGEPAKKLRDFKDLLGKRHTIDFFQSPKDLAFKVENKLKEIFSEKDLVIEKERLKPSVQPEKTASLLEKFDLIPKKYAGSEIELIIKFLDSPRSVYKKLCVALGLPFGYSISRPISIIHPADVSREFSFLEKLFGEYDGCDFLYNAPINKEFKVVVRLAFGEERNIVRQPPPFSLGVTSLMQQGPRPIKDLDTDEPPFEDYIYQSSVKAIILVKTIKAQESKKS